MNIQHKWKGFSLSPGIITLSLFSAGALFSLILHDAFAHPELPVSTIVLSQASERRVTSTRGSTEPGVTAPLIRLEIDAAQTRAADPELLQDLRSDIAQFAGTAVSLSETPPAPTEQPSISSDWNKWSRLESPRAAATLLDTPPDQGLRTYAVHSREGATLCLVNRTQLKMPLRLTFHLPHSIYKLERLTFTPRDEAAGSQKPAVFSSLPPEKAAHTDARLEQLQGRDLTSSSAFGFPYRLEAGQVCIIRLTDTAFASRMALNLVRDRLKTLNKGSSELSSRLHVILDGSASFEKALASNSSLTPERRRSQIHRFLLVLGQAHSLHHNFQLSRTVQAEQGDAFMASLERLNEALADTSAALLGLVPQVDLALETEPAARKQTGVQLLPVSQTDEVTHSARMMISLSNTGRHSVGLVKIGVVGAFLPPNVHCDPEEPALFGTLAPNQTVRATYSLHWNGPLSLPANRCVGDVSYFMDGAPAHLRLRPW